MTAIELDLPHADYLAHPALSASGAKQILRSPAHYRWNREHPAHNEVFDIGHAVHEKVLGTGPGIDVLDFPNWMTKAAKEARAESWAAGRAAVLAKDYEPVEAMAEALLAHPLAKAVLERPGAAEASLFAQDPESGVHLRSRLDWLLDHRPGARTLCVDLKTAMSADPYDFRATAARNGYDIQSEFHQHVVRLARGDEDTAFLFVVVEKFPPYLVSVIELDAEYASLGRSRMRRAIDLFKACTESGEWPGYAPIVHTVEPPRWFAMQEETL